MLLLWCENSCPDDLILVKRKDVEINDPKKKGTYPWVKGWINSIEEILRKRLITGKEQKQIPIIEEEIKILTKKIEEKIPQLSKDDRKKFTELNDKVQSFLKSSKIRYWIKDQKSEKVRKELSKILNQES
jgi:hypothetical protein